MKIGVSMLYFPLRSTIITAISNLIWMDSSFDVISDIIFDLSFHDTVWKKLDEFFKRYEQFAFCKCTKKHGIKWQTQS
jgi:hypothetical protein